MKKPLLESNDVMLAISENLLLSECFKVQIFALHIFTNNNNYTLERKCAPFPLGSISFSYIQFTRAIYFLYTYSLDYNIVELETYYTHVNTYIMNGCNQEQ